MKSILDACAGFLIQQSWQISIVFGIVLAVCWVLRSASAHWRYLLWIVLIAKCLMPPVVSMQLPVLPEDKHKPPFELASQLTKSNVVSMVNASPAEIVQPPDPISEVTHSATQPFAARSTASAASRWTPEPLSVRHWLVIAWLLIVGILIVQLAGRMWSTTRRLKRTSKPADDRIQSDVAALAKELGLKKPPSVRMANCIAQPFVLGWLRGGIYLPLGFSSMGTVEQRRAILIHELAHVLRWDSAVNHLQNLIQALFFFHPLVWRTNQKIRQEREKCCDEIVLSTSNVPPSVYCEAIVDTMRRPCAFQLYPPALAATGSIKSVKERITTMLSPNRKFRQCPSRVAVSATLLFAICVLPTAVLLTSPRRIAAQDDLSIPETKNASSEAEAGETVGQSEFKVSAAEFASAADTLRKKGGFVRTFYERGNPEYWVQVILESRAAGVETTFEPVDETKAPTFSDEDLAVVRKLTLDSPAHVHLRGGVFTAVGIKHLDATKISRFELSGCPFEDSMAAELSKLTSLEELSYDNSKLTALGIEGLLKCTQLKSIDFGNRSGVPEIEILPKLPNLEAVSILAPLDERAVSVLNACDQIKSVTLTITDGPASEAFSAITSLRSLSKASLSGDGITDELIIELTRTSPNLKELYLRNHQGATLPAMKAIAALPMIEVLSLDGSNVTDAGIVALKEARNLRWLDIGRTQVTDRSLKKTRGQAMYLTTSGNSGKLCGLLGRNQK